MDSAKNIAIGTAVENMIQTEGWKHVDKYLVEREIQYTSELKNAKTMDVVIELQAQLKMIDRLRAKLKEWIQNKNSEIRGESNGS